MKPLPRPISGVLFDLDGTLLDSAPGLYAALEALAAESGITIAPYDAIRDVVSRGATAVLKTAWPDIDAETLEARMPRFIELYAAVMGDMTHAFDGIDPLLEALEAAGLPWGIVTNKAGYLARPLLEQMGLWQRAASVVAGDTLAQRKPDPAPVLHACLEACIKPAQTVFVGDDQRDIQAGRDAGLYTVAVAWGYLDGGDPHDWGADKVVDHPDQLTALLRLDLPA